MERTINDIVREVVEDESEREGEGFRWAALNVAPCKNCKDNFFKEDLIWADRGNMAWLCQECYNTPKREGES